MDRKRFTFVNVLLVAFVVTALIFMITKKEDSKVNIGKSDIQVEDGKLTPEVLWSMGRIGGVTTSPDGSRLHTRSLITAYRRMQATRLST